MEPAEPPPVVIVAQPPPLPAPPEPDPREEAIERGPPLQNGGFSISIGALAFVPDLSNVTFSGSGVPTSGTNATPFTHRGRELGLRSPIMAGGELDLHYTRRWFAVGLMGFVATRPTPSDDAPDPPNNIAATQVNQATMVSYGFGLDLAGALPVNDHVALRLGPLTGLRAYSLAMTGFEPTTCHSRRGDFPCAERATAAQLFLEPRARVEISPTGGAFMLGAYAGYDVVGGGVAGGIFLGLHTPHGKLLP
jgi:hypothetical protein